MRFGVCAAVAGVVFAVVAHALQPAEPFVPIGVWYGGGTSRAPMVSLSDCGRSNQAMPGLYRLEHPSRLLPMLAELGRVVAIRIDWRTYCCPLSHLAAQRR